MQDQTAHPQIRSLYFAGINRSGPDLGPTLPILGARKHEALGTALSGAILNDQSRDSDHFAEVNLHPGIRLIARVKSKAAIGLLAAKESRVIGGSVVNAGRTHRERRILADDTAVYGLILEARAQRAYLLARAARLGQG